MLSLARREWTHSTENIMRPRQVSFGLEIPPTILFEDEEIPGPLTITLRTLIRIEDNKGSSLVP